MKFVNVLDNVKVDDIVSMRLGASCPDMLPAIIIETNNQGVVLQDLDEGFKIHYCNEFLRSLNLHSENIIRFTTYSEYHYLLDYINTLLAIRKSMEEVSGKLYDEIGFSAQQVHQVILNYLLRRHRMATNGWEYAMHRRPLNDWVQETLALLLA